MISLHLLTPRCFEEIFVKFNLEPECVKYLLSRGLGLGIVAGSTMVKLPQIFKILGNRDAAGLSFLGVLLELLAVTANGAYSISQGFPFSAYGESVFLSLQTSLIAILILWYGGNTVSTVVFSAIYGAVVFAITQPGLVPEDVLWYGQAANIPMVVIGKLIQVATNYKNQHTGQLSAVTSFLLTAGSVVRIFTSIQDTGDWVLIMTYIASSAVNIIISLQVWAYWDRTKEVLHRQQIRKMT